MTTAAAGGFIDLYFTIDGQQEVSQRLLTFGAEISDFSEAWQQVGEDLLGDFMLQFMSQGGEYGAWSEWDALADSTVLERERLGYGGEGPIEVRTGALRAAVTEQGAAGNVFEVLPDMLRVGFDDQIGTWQHYGTRKMPARPLIGLSQYRKSEIVNRIDDFIKQVIIQSGLGA